MKIVHVTNSYLPNAGGVASSVSTHLGAVERLDMSCSVICPDNGHHQPGNVLVLDRNTWDAVISGKFPPSCDSLIRKSDVVHAHGPFFLGQLAVCLSRRFGKPLVYTHHTLLEHYRHYVTSETLTESDIVSFHSAYCNACDHVIAPSRSIRNLLIAREVKSPISVIPTGLDDFWYFDASKDMATRMAVRKMYLKDDQDTLIAAVGRLSHEKNILSLMKTISDVLLRDARVHFLLIGEGTLIHDIKQMIARRGLENQCTLEGYVDRCRLSEIYKGLDVFVTSSVSEVQALTLIEAQAAGAVLLHEPSPVPDEFSGVLQDSSQVGAENLHNLKLANKLAWYLQLNRKEKNKLRHSAMELAGRYSISSMGDMLKNLYSHVALTPKSSNIPDQPQFREYSVMSRDLMKVISSMEQKREPHPVADKKVRDS